MSLEARLEPYKVTQAEPEPKTFETTWCLVHMASASSLQTRCYYSLNAYEDTACQLVPAQVSC